MYSIKEIADLAGVTTRTLRYYHQLGLLHPAFVDGNGYRFYNQDNLLKLQQVMFFRELDIPLKEIQKILEAPDYEPLQALVNHRKAIDDRVQRLGKLLNTLDRTIISLQGEKMMSDKELFEGFDERLYESEARELWGDSSKYQESQQKWSSYTESQREEIKEEGNQIIRRMVTEDHAAQPDDPAVQEAVADYYAYLNRYFYTCDPEFLRGLANMWVEDPRFSINYERIREGGAAFVREAVNNFCDHQ